MLRIKSKDSHTLGKCYRTESHSQPPLFSVMIETFISSYHDDVMAVGRHAAGKKNRFPGFPSGPTENSFLSLVHLASAISSLYMTLGGE